MTLRVVVHSMEMPAVRPEIVARWQRKALRLPPLTRSERLIGPLSLEVRSGEVLAIVGESASGKSTLLRILAGLETRFAGEVLLDGESMRRPNKRVYLMPQEHTTLPWLTVERNLLFCATPNDGVDVKAGVEKALAGLRLEGRRNAYPRTLSGGERARVALACAMVAEPDVLLLDEPFRSLDEVTSEGCQDDLLEWLKQTERREAVLLVSHSIAEAVFLGDRLMVVRGRPLEVAREFDVSRLRVRRTPEAMDCEAAVFEVLKEAARERHHERTETGAPG